MAMASLPTGRPGSLLCDRYQSSSSSSLRSWGSGPGASRPGLEPPLFERWPNIPIGPAPPLPAPIGASPAAAAPAAAPAATDTGDTAAPRACRPDWPSTACAPMCRRRRATTPPVPDRRPSSRPFRRPAGGWRTGWLRSGRPERPCLRPAAHLAEDRRHLLQRLRQLLHRLGHYLPRLLRKLARAWNPAASPSACPAACPAASGPAARLLGGVLCLLRLRLRHARGHVALRRPHPACSAADSCLAWALTVVNAAFADAPPAPSRAAWPIAAAAAASPTPGITIGFGMRDRFEHRVQHRLGLVGVHRRRGQIPHPDK